ncbi:MAG: alpha-galactosidase [Bryobacteraceae bacterium]|nr:alpha-galactosidase [Bryobacteraceae bacterium]
MYTARQIMHFRNPVLNSSACLVAASLLACISAYSEPAASARRWVDAKFLGVADPDPQPAQIRVSLKSGTLRRNGIQDRHFLIAGKSFEHGVAMSSPGEIIVRLPGPAQRFQSVAGVDSNDIGYYSNGGRGSVVASVEVNGQEAFRSPVLHEGLAGIPIDVDLKGAREFTLKLTAVGERKHTDQAEWDQADWAGARVTLAGGEKLWLADLPLGPLGGPFSTEAPFSFRYDGKNSAEFLKTWRQERASRRLDAVRTEHVVTYTDPQTGLSVRCVGVAYSDFPVVEWTVYLKNTGSAPTPIVEQLQAIDTRFIRTPEGEFLLHHSKGSPNSATDFQPLTTSLGSGNEKRFVAAGGRPTDADLSYFNLEWARQGVIVGLGWPGQWAAAFTRDQQRGIRIAAGQELTHFRLLPGEEVRTPLVALLFWEGTWIDSQNVWRRWMIADNLPRPGGKLPPPQLAGSSGRQTIEMQGATEDNQKSFLNRLLKTGIKLDYWWMDAGWYSFPTGWWNTGTWDPDPRRFPNGFTPVSKEAHARGVKIIVWFEPERVTAGSWLWENHPEWLLGKKDQDRLLFLGNPEARAWLTDHVAKIIAGPGPGQDIDIYRQDFNFPPLAIWRANDAPDRQGITENQHVTGYLAYWDELRRRFPRLLIDTCSSGGRRLDLETLRRSVPLWRSDFAYDPPAMQQQTYGLALWVPYFGTAFNSTDPYIFWSQITPAAGTGMDFERMESNAAQLRKLTGEWRSIAGLYYGDYYPLTPYSTDSTAWLAWQFNDPAAHKGMVQAFRRPESPFETARFRLSGLEPGANYLVRDLDSAITTPHSGKSLMETGLSVNIGLRPGAKVLVYSKAQ